MNVLRMIAPKTIRVVVLTEKEQEFSLELLASDSFNKLLAPHYGARQVLDEIERLAKAVK